MPTKVTSCAADRLVIGEPDAVTRACVEAVMRAERGAEQARGEFRIALAGGTTPRPAYELLARQSEVHWAGWRVFFSDERCVPRDHPQSNFHLAEQCLLSRVDIAAEHVHRMRGELQPTTAAEAYEAELGQEPLDLVLLGMGDDGHTASLFPGSGALEERSRLVLPTRAPVAPHERLTLSLPALARAHCACFLVCGASKAARLAEVFAERDAGAPVLPAARVAADAVEFYVDTAAAAELPPHWKSKARAP
jgi:6-phosphogluconolactonase